LLATARPRNRHLITARSRLSLPPPYPTHHQITRHKQAEAGIKPASTFKVFADIYRREGIAGINKGVNAVALRQMTNWGSRWVFLSRASPGIPIAVSRHRMADYWVERFGTGGGLKQNGFREVGGDGYP
jgi:hypothetical protein